ncbi:MAG: hypothetical protein JWN38_656 [Candidatus Saccharibacteria bacterium]|nr:hypothetical protein [Candidatus Saccharibacteria bacterium]
MAKDRSARRQFVTALSLASLASVGLFCGYALVNDDVGYDFMIWNLLLAWIPLLLAYRLTLVLRDKLWSSWEAIIMTLLWVLFLPNSFYMISDYIHLQDVSDNRVLYVATMFSSFIFTAMLLGLSSLYLVHLEFRKRYSGRASTGILTVLLLICSFAIYIGRDLRWNSWDLFLNPSGLIFDMSDRLLQPLTYPQMFVVTGSFFVLLSAAYYIAWSTVRLLRTTEK